MITLRFSMMLRAWRADPRADDWRVEKDKCEMYRFFLRNHLPVMHIYRAWEGGEPAGCEGPLFADECAEASAAHVYEELLPGHAGVGINGVATDDQITYPAVLKCCHLTQAPAHTWGIH